MPVVIAIVSVIGVIFILVSLVPLIAGAIATALLGKQAKLETDDKIMLGFIFYLVMWAIFAVMIFSSGEIQNPIWNFLVAIVASIFWPFPIGIMWTNGLLGYTDQAIEATIVFAIGFAITQVIAIFMVLNRANKRIDD